MNSTQKFKLMQTSRGALSTRLDTNSMGGLPGINSVRGVNRNALAQKHYANIDLFKIPDVHFRKIKKNTTSMDEDPSTNLESKFETWGQSFDNEGDLSDPDLIVKQAVEEAKLNHISRKAQSLFQTARPSVHHAFDSTGNKGYTTSYNFPDVKPFNKQRASLYNASDKNQTQVHANRQNFDMNDLSQTGKSFKRGSNKRSPKSRIKGQDMENAPVIHM
jgi:hypothetical protein